MNYIRKINKIFYYYCTNQNYMKAFHVHILKINVVHFYIWILFIDLFSTSVLQRHDFMFLVEIFLSFLLLFFTIINIVPVVNN